LLLDQPHGRQSMICASCIGKRPSRLFKPRCFSPAFNKQMEPANQKGPFEVTPNDSEKGPEHQHATHQTQKLSMMA
jgi:hypothetical protein